MEKASDTRESRLSFAGCYEGSLVCRCTARHKCYVTKSTSRKDLKDIATHDRGPNERSGKGI